MYKYISISALFLVSLLANCNEPTPPPDDEPFWHYYETPTPADWLGLGHEDETNVWIAGVRDTGAGMTLWFDGISIRKHTPPVGTKELRDCCVQAENSVWFVGVDAAVYRFNGESFEIWDAPAGELNDVDMGAFDFGFAVGDGGTILEFDGSVWTQAESPTTADLNSVEFVSAGAAWAVGDDGTILHYVGGAWIIIMPFTQSDLYDTSFITPDDGWFVGSSGAVYHYNGSGWTPYDVPRTDVNFYCAAFPASDKGWVGGDGTTLLVYDGEAFSRESNLPTGPWELKALTAPTADEAWGVGPGIILYYK
jgi:hypothetical protein